MGTAIAELGSRLQLEQGILWLHRTKGDPYARVLSGFDDDPHPAYRRIRARGRLWRSTLGTWVTADRELGGELIDHPGIEHVLPLEEASFPFTDPTPDLPGACERACERVLDGLGERGDDFDLVADLAERVPVELIADLYELPAEWRIRLADGLGATGIAMDAVLCPQRLPDTRRMLAALDDFRALFAEVADDPAAAMLLAVVGARAGADLIANTVLRAAPAEEALRLDPPARLAPMVARDDFRLDGQDVEKGDRITVMVEAAGLPRPAPPHRVLTPLYRSMAEAVARGLAGRFEEIRPSGPVLRRRRAPVTRGLLRCPMTAKTGRRRR